MKSKPKIIKRKLRKSIRHKKPTAEQIKIHQLQEQLLVLGKTVDTQNVTISTHNKDKAEVLEDVRRIQKVNDKLRIVLGNILAQHFRGAFAFKTTDFSAVPLIRLKSDQQISLYTVYIGDAQTTEVERDGIKNL